MVKDLQLLIADPDFNTLHTLYISPLKALAVDVQRNLLTPNLVDSEG